MPIDKGAQRLSKVSPRQSLSRRLPTSLRRPERLGRFGLRGTLIKELSQFLCHRAAELLGVDDRHGAPIIARHVMADAYGDELDRGAGLDLLDHITQVALEIVAGIHGKG